MSDPSSEGPDDPLLSTGSTGDVLAARQVARELLTASKDTLPDLVDPVLATLVLTAACLHNSVMLSGGVRRSDLVRHFNMVLEVGTPGPALLNSRMQFVRYAAAEVTALAPRRRCCLLLTLLRIVSPAGELVPCDDDKDDKISQQVRK